jgi:hypothetical protein
MMGPGRLRGAAAAIAPLVLIVACSTGGTTTSGQPAPPVDSGPNCRGRCCEKPEPGTFCDATDAGPTTCTWAVTCPGGLVIGRTTKCENGSFVSVVDCPLPGQADANGCPAEPPAPNSPCVVLKQGVQCGYSVACAPVCDGSACVPARRSTTATCVQGAWQTQALPPC